MGVTAGKFFVIKSKQSQIFFIKTSHTIPRKNCFKERAEIQKSEYLPMKAMIFGWKNCKIFGKKSKYFRKQVRNMSECFVLKQLECFGGKMWIFGSATISRKKS